jgi:hypothetical protein
MGNGNAIPISEGHRLTAEVFVLVLAMPKGNSFMNYSWQNHIEICLKESTLLI